MAKIEVTVGDGVYQLETPDSWTDDQVSAEVDRFSSAHLGPTKPPASELEPGLLEKYGPTAAKIGLGIGGMMLAPETGGASLLPLGQMIGGAAGFGLGEYVKEKLEGKKTDPYAIAGSAGGGALPIKNLSMLKGLGRVGAETAQGLYLANAGTAIDSLITKGELPSKEELWNASKIGGGMGFGLGALFGRGGAEAAPTLQKAAESTVAPTEAELAQQAAKDMYGSFGSVVYKTKPDGKLVLDKSGNPIPMTAKELSEINRKGLVGPDADAQTFLKQSREGAGATPAKTAKERAEEMYGPTRQGGEVSVSNKAPTDPYMEGNAPRAKTPKERAEEMYGPPGQSGDISVSNAAAYDEFMGRTNAAANPTVPGEVVPKSRAASFEPANREEALADYERARTEVAPKTSQEVAQEMYGSTGRASGSVGVGSGADAGTYMGVPKPRELTSQERAALETKTELHQPAPPVSQEGRNSWTNTVVQNTKDGEVAASLAKKADADISSKMLRVFEIDNTAKNLKGSLPLLTDKAAIESANAKLQELAQEKANLSKEIGDQGIKLYSGLPIPEASRYIIKTLDAIKDFGRQKLGKTWAPYLVDKPAEITAASLRQRVGTMAGNVEQQRYYLEKFSEWADKNMTPLEKVESIASFQNPQKFGQIKNETTKAMFTALDSLLDKGRKDLLDLGMGHEKWFHDNYFPQIWKDPKKAERFISFVNTVGDKDNAVLADAMTKMDPTARRDFVNRLLAGSDQVDPQKAALAEKLKNIVPTFKNADDANSFLDSVAGYFGQKGSITGRQSFLRPRKFEDVMAGKAAGLELVTDNPVELALAKYAEIEKYVAGQRLMKDLEGEGLVKWYKNPHTAPPGWQQIDDKVARRLGSKGTEFAFAPEGATRILNNFYEPRSSWASGNFRATSNYLNQVQLGFSGFHLGTTTINSMASNLSDAMLLASRGQIDKAAKKFLTGITPYSVIDDFRRGSKIVDSFLKGAKDSPEYEFAKMYTEANGKLRPNQDFINESVKKFKQALRDGNVVKTAGYALPALTEKLSAPLFQKLIPNVKVAAFTDMAAEELARLPASAGKIERLQAMQRAADIVDQRFGMVNYDNFFWKSAMRDSAFLLMRAPGWNIGSFRELGGGVYEGFDNALRKAAGGEGARLTQKTAFVASLAAVTGLYGTLYQYAKTGTLPKMDLNDIGGSLNEMAHPWTGGYLPNGEKERVSLPSYAKDADHIIRAIGSGDSKKLFDMGIAKANPLLTDMYRMFYSNEDFRHQKIRDEDASYATQAKQLAKYGARDVLPFSFQNIPKGAMQAGAQMLPEALQPAGNWMADTLGSNRASVKSNFSPMESIFTGITPASRDATDTPFMSRVRDFQSTSNSREERGVLRAEAKAEIIDKLRSDRPSAGKALQKYMKQDIIKQNDLKELLGDASLRPKQAMVKHLSFPELADAMTLADPKERKELMPFLMKKYDGGKWVKTTKVGQEDIQKAMENFRKVLTQGVQRTPKE